MVVTHANTKLTMTSSDASVKQLLLQMDTDDFRFIIQDLDDTHLLVDPKSVQQLKLKFESRLEENVFKLADGVVVNSTW